MTAKKKLTTTVSVTTPPRRPAGIQQMGPDLYAQIRAALLELNAAASH